MKIRNFLLSTLALGCSIAIGNLPQANSASIRPEINIDRNYATKPTYAYTVATNFEANTSSLTMSGDGNNFHYFNNTTTSFNLYNGSNVDTNFKVDAYGNGSCFLRRYNSGKDTYVYMRYNAGSDSATPFTGSRFNIVPLSSTVSYSITSFTYTDLGLSEKTTSANCLNYRYSTDGVTFVDKAIYASCTDGKFIVSDLPEGIKYFTLAIDKDGSNKTYGFVRSLSINYQKDGCVKLKFDTKGGSEIDDELYLKGDIPEKPENPTKANNGSTKYTFGGWYTDSECTVGNEYNFDTAINADTTIYAKWIESQVTGATITFHTNGLHSVTSQTVESGVKFVEPVITDHIGDAKYDYTLVGWYTDETYATEFDFDVAYTEDKDAYAKYSYAQNVLSGATTVSMKGKVQTYAYGWSIDNYEEHIVTSSSVSLSMVDSVFNYKNAYSDQAGGIKFTGTKNQDGSITYKYDVKMRYCVATWQLVDYSKYIKTVRWDLKNTGYQYNKDYIVDLFDNVECTGTAIDSDHLCLVSGENNRCIQMVDNTNEAINGVAFKQRKVKFDYGFEKLQYILGEASAAQQAKNFAKDFLDLMTCSGEGSITAESGSWALLASRVSSYLSTDAKTLLTSYDGSDQTIIDALARYDYIVAKYGTSSYDNFLNRTISSKGGPLLSLSKLGSSVTTDAIVVSVAVICLVTLGSLYFFKKRKENF